MSDHSDMDAGVARRRAARGVIFLGLRSAAVQICAFAGTVVLSRALEPSDFGTFAVLQFVLSFFQVFGDAGIGAALIQSRTPPSEDALGTVFTFHLLLGLGVVGVVWLAAPALFSVWPKLPPSAPWLLRAMSVTFLLTALRAIPALVLERSLRFGAVAVAEVAQIVAFYVVASACALAGLRDWTWPVALFAQATVGAIVIWVAQPWRPRLSFDVALLKPLLRFGLPFQLKNLVGFANGALTPLFGGAVLGTAAVGLLGWGQQLAYLPLRLVEVVARVAFPLFSRLQYDRDGLARVFERALQFCALAIFFTSALFLTAGPNITVVVFSRKWLEGLVALYAFSAVILIGFVSPVVGAIFDALGRPAIIARLALGWTALNWVVTPLAAWRWGFPGFVYGTCAHVVVGNAAVLVVLRFLVPEARIARSLAGPAVGATLVAAFGWFVLRPWANTPLRLAAGVAAALAAHLIAFAIVDPHAPGAMRRLVFASERELDSPG